MKDIKESIAVIEHVIESKFLNLRDLNQEDAKEFNDHWEAINIVPKLEKDFCINSKDQRDNYLSMIEGMQEVILDDLDKNLFDDLKFKSLAVIQYLLENIKCYPFVLNVNEEIYEWIQEVKIQVEESE
jgi:type IV secretory pathway VirB6-like protein